LTAARARTLINIAVTVLVLVFLLSRQLSAWPLRDRSLIGPIDRPRGSAQFFINNHLGVGDVAL
jgi:hypothetical protein